jgi:hypothetical protein
MRDEKLGIALVKRACPACGSPEDAEIIMNTRLTKHHANEVESLNGKTIGYLDKPCKSCNDLMSKGFLLIGCVSSLTDDLNNPYRSGHQWVITNEAAKRMFSEETITKGVAFIDVEDAKKLGFPINLQNEN